MNYSDIAPVQTLLKSVGRNIVEWRNDKSAKKIYSGAGFKTEADRRSHALMKDGLHALHPGIDVISEEDARHSDERPDAYWLIDPIDGTASWFHGFDGFVTQAAYIENSVPIFGIVHAPAFDKTWSAFAGKGAKMNDQLLPHLSVSERLVLIDNTSEPHGITRALMSLLPCTGYVESGSLGLKSVLVADGTADLFFKDVCVRDWDLAPAAVILQEVGGLLIQATNKSYNFDGSYMKNSGIIIARDQMLLSMVIDALNVIQNRA